MRTISKMLDGSWSFEMIQMMLAKESPWYQHIATAATPNAGDAWAVTMENSVQLATTEGGVPAPNFPVDESFPFPTGGTAFSNIVSTDADDDGSPAGNGARGVMTIGLLDDNTYKAETTTTNGLTPWAGSETFQMCMLHTVTAAGTSLWNEGDITFDDGSTFLQGQIRAKRKVGMNPCFGVATDYRFYVHDVEIGDLSGAGCEGSFYQKAASGAVSTIANIGSTGKVRNRIPIHTWFPAGTTLWIQCLNGSGGNLQMSGQIRGILEYVGS